MSDRSDDPGGGAGEPKPPKIKAEDNPWYLLATLYGEANFYDDELAAKNRVAWNRYFAANLDEETRTKLVEEKRHTADELTPFSPEELQEIATAFAERCKASANKPALPASNADIDFSNVEFKQDASFNGYLFTDYSKFRNATFSHRASFDSATFSGRVIFVGTAFSGEADFGGAAFPGTTYFNDATFSQGASFDSATFSGSVSFGGAAFSGVADFRGAAFPGGAIFDDAAFSDRANFFHATFSNGAWFAGATFSGWASFVGAAFSNAYFHSATFDRGSSFINAEMKGESSFEGAIFKTEPPKFFDAKLHQGTVWRGIKWPLVPKNKDEAGTFLDAYACLKLEMDRLRKHEDELDFFAREMESRRIYLGPWRGLPFAIYGALSGYGRSYLRPLVALLAVAAFGAAVFWYFDARTFGEALGLSAANTLNVFGFRRDLGLAIDTPLAWLKAFSAVQTILGTILLFLFGLGIRNKFRVK